MRFDLVKLSTERLTLRPLNDADAQSLFTIFSDAKVMRYMNTGPWSSIDKAHEMIAKDAVELPAGLSLRLGLETKIDSKLIGHCSLFKWDKGCRRAEVGYGMASGAWGKGYMHEALTALLNYGFEEMQLNRVEADIDPRNVASAKSLERLGFQKEGFLRERWIVEDEVSDSAIYGLLRKEWFTKVG
jgi:[ribosomal protein S5]-alanine N-acetyltransferase